MPRDPAQPHSVEEFAVGSLKPGVIPKLAVPATPEAIVRAVKSMGP